MTSTFPPGAGDQGPKGPDREPLHPDEREGRADAGSARPPSERGRVVPEHQGVGVFRLAGWGWSVTIAVVLFVGAIVVVGYLRDDPGRNPAPAAYPGAVCTAAAELRAGTEALAAGVEGAGDEAADRVDARVGAAVSAVDGLPEWIPGRALDELIGRQIITLTNGATALREEDAAASSDLSIARATDEEIAGHLDGRYGFTC